MKCQLCGNVAQHFYKNGEIYFIHIYQCPSCKTLACSECMETGSFEAEVQGILDSAGIENVKATICPKCGANAPSFIK